MYTWLCSSLQGTNRLIRFLAPDWCQISRHIRLHQKKIGRCPNYSPASKYYDSTKIGFTTPSMQAKVIAFVLYSSLQRHNTENWKQISIFMFLWAIYCTVYIPRNRSAFSAEGKYEDRSWKYINRSQTHEFGGHTIPFLGIHKSDFCCSATYRRNWWYKSPVLIVWQPFLTYRPARLAESITWNRLLGSLNVYKFGLSTRITVRYMHANSYKCTHDYVLQNRLQPPRYKSPH
jgi:hypothetical protein